jgi:hypothetical protein
MSDDRPYRDLTIPGTLRSAIPAALHGEKRSRGSAKLSCRSWKGWQFSDIARIVPDDDGGLEIRCYLLDTIN